MTSCDYYYPDIFTVRPDYSVELSDLERKEANETISPNERPRLTELRRFRTQSAIQREMYLALRKILREDFNFDPAADCDDGKGKKVSLDGTTTLDAAQFPTGFDADRGKCADSKADATALKSTVFFASVAGILLSRNQSDPSQGRRETEFPGSNAHWFSEDLGGNLGTIHFRISQGWREQVANAVQQYLGNRRLYTRVFDVLRREGRGNATDPANIGIKFTIRSRQLAEVANRLDVLAVAADDPQIERQVKLALSQSLSGTADGIRSTARLQIPDLDAGVAHDIVPANVAAASIIYFSAMLEDMRFHATMEKCVEHFSVGMLPISNVRVGDRIYQWIKSAPERLSEIERRGVYGRVLGLAQGSVTDVVPNRPFLDLFRRFASNVSLLARDQATTNTRVITEQQAHKSGRDLAVNLSLHGYGISHFAATEMLQIYNQIREVLFETEILRAYGVLDEWQLVDRIANLYLGGATNGVRYRTMATTGGRILQWLADHAVYFAPGQPALRQLLDDSSLISDAEQWLAVTGTPDSTVSELTDPVDMQEQPTLPYMSLGNSSNNGVQQTVRNALDQVGNGLPSIPAV